MDPYKSPSLVAEPNEQMAEFPQTPKRTFRWRVIPASICWLIGSLMLIAFPFAIVNNWKYLGVNFDDSLPWVLLDIAGIVRIPSIFGFGLALLYAGNRWMKGRWISAIAFSVIPWFLLVCLKELTEYLEAWAINLP